MRKGRKEEKEGRKEEEKMLLGVFEDEARQKQLLLLISFASKL